jgi:GLPGLI family protein
MIYIRTFFFAVVTVAYMVPMAQEMARYQVAYDCVFNLQFDRQKMPVPYHAQLVSAEGRSFFAAVRDKQFELPETEEFQHEPDTIMQLVKIPETGELVFQVPGISGKPESYRDTLHAINWVLTDEQKKIDSLTCFKATAFFRGRNYIAWYAASIPVPDGPWKLDGLPGLVIEAYEEKKDLYFLARSIRFNAPGARLPEIRKPALYPGFPEYVAQIRSLLETIRGSMATQESGNCLECQTKSKVVIYLWEKVAE